MVEVKKKAAVIQDKHGRPNYMTVFYLDRYPELTPEEKEAAPDMFKVCGRVVPGVAISQFTNSMIDGIPYSLPLQKSAADLDHDEAQEACRRKGAGWHLMTNCEWVYLLDDAHNSGHEICGNTDFGRDADHPEQAGWKFNSSFTLTGADPLQWSHDGTPFGVFGLKGNYWEHVTGLRLHKGAVEYLKNNDAAETGDKDCDWTVAAVGEDPLRLDPTSTGVVITTASRHRHNTAWNGCHYSDLKVDLDVSEIPEILHRLGVVPRDWKSEKAGLFADQKLEEAVPYRGSGFNNASIGGAAALNLFGPRSYGSNLLSFRSALLLENWELITDLLK